MLNENMKRVNDIPQEYFEEQNRLKLLQIKKRNELEKLREERVASMDYEKELERTDLTHKQRMFYSKMAKWQKNQKN
mgnify:FL=1|tara:strand:+ start:454 stop:684 length:231 start_codon:yes stop_codon:yes gene_type:complete